MHKNSRYTSQSHNLKITQTLVVLNIKKKSFYNTAAYITTARIDLHSIKLGIRTYVYIYALLRTYGIYLS